MTSCNGEGKKKGRGVWLLGGTIDEITGSKLPSNCQVLRRFFHLHYTDKQTIQASATTTTREVLLFWEKAKIPTRQDCHIINKIKDLHSTWQLLKKSASRRTEVQQRKEEAFVEVFNDIFDIAHADASTLIKIPEDREFLLAQREKGRRGCMGSIDTKLARKEDRRQQRVAAHEVKKSKEVNRYMTESKTVQLSESNIALVASTSSDDDFSAETALPSKIMKPSKSINPEISSAETVLLPKIMRPSKIISPEISSALDRSKLSDRNAVYVLAAAAQSLGHDPQKLVINRESIRQARREYRETIAKEIRASFHPDLILTVHWDGKMLPDLTKNKSIDRLAVLVSGEGTMKLLGVPKIHNSTGEAQATAVFNLIQEWNLIDRVRLMSFDTTASNTGLKSGACVLLEQNLNRNLVSLPCRHHIMELIVARVFGTLMETSSGPNIKLFQRFADCWTSIDKQSYKSGVADESIALQFESDKDDLVSLIHFQLSQFQPRDDYRELLQLGLLFLGAALPADATIHQPGALHRARWMAKLIYSLKIYLFRFQFRLTSHELLGLSRFNVFVMKVYLKAWYTCQCATSAPRNDLALLRNLGAYMNLDATVAKAAIKSFSGHLWYLSEMLIGLAFFDSNVATHTKIDMVTALQREESDNPPRRITFEETITAGKELSDFVSVNTRMLFVSLDLNQDFLKEDPSIWDTNNDYIRGQTLVRKLKVVNDPAERGVALCHSFNAVLSNQEEQKQFLLQVIEKHQQDFPNSNKSTVVKTIVKQ
jgi:hypothetical protein